MADVDKLLQDYIAEHRAGGAADPREFLARVEGGERAELAALIDTFLSRSPGRAWDAQAFEGSKAQFATDRILADWERDPGADGAIQGWRELLPALRHRAELKRRELVERLAAGIGHPDSTGLVGSYYHQMELGRLPAEGVSNRVLEVLGDIFGESAQQLRAAGSLTVPGNETEADLIERASFARIAIQDPDFDGEGNGDVAEGDLGAMSEPLARTEVDRLFTGGPEAG